MMQGPSGKNRDDRSSTCRAPGFHTFPRNPYQVVNIPQPQKFQTASGSLLGDTEMEGENLSFHLNMKNQQSERKYESSKPSTLLLLKKSHAHRSIKVEELP
jgi:hypothetical protein